MESTKPTGREQWLEDVKGDACLYIQFYRDHALEYEPEELESLKAHFSGRLPLSVSADVSGRHDGTEQVLAFVRALLTRFPGVASDDFSDHLWTLPAIEANARFDGLTFFDYLGYHKREHGQRRMT